MLSSEIKLKVNDYLSRSKMWALCNILLEKENNIYKDLNLENLKHAIYYAVDKIETIRVVLPKFTVHGIQHSCNVLDIMEKLLESMDIITIDNNGEISISSYEIAMLVLAAFFHDIGMCLLDENWDVSQEEWYDSYLYDKLHLDENNFKKEYIRDCHHLRVKLFIDDYRKKNTEFGWFEKNGNKKTFLELERICKSHNEGKESLDKLGNIIHQDEKFCAILLRLADILDLDNTRAPLSEMEAVVFEDTEKDIYSWYEWKKHRDAEGISFDTNGFLVLLGKADDAVVYQKLNSMVAWIRAEFDLCRDSLRSVSAPYRDKRLPQMIINKVEAKGFEIGHYTYEIDKNDAINLFMGEKLYMDKMVFIRELLQNAIDASIYYNKIKEKELRNLGYIGEVDVNPVTIHVWKDDTNNVSFLIEDNGIGMNREIISNYFLKIGKSFYNSDKFLHSNVNFMPISRFGIGFLSAFLATDEIIVVTKHYNEPNVLLQLTLNRNTDEYVLRENNRNSSKYDINQHITDWNGRSNSLAKMFKEKQCGTVIYFNIRQEFSDGDMEQFITAINKYLLFSPVSVSCDINGRVFDYKKLEKPFMKNSLIKLDKAQVCRVLHKNPKAFNDDEEIYFEALPVSIDYSDNNGQINGEIYILTVYDTRQKNNIYNFSYSLNYEANSIIIRLGGYQKEIINADLNSEYQTLNLTNDIKIYFNGINHLSTTSNVQNNTVAPSFFNGFLMLDGKYRPEVDIARSGKGYLDLETMACINYLFWKELQNYAKDDFIKRNAYFSLKQPDLLLNINNTIYTECEIHDKVIKSFEWNDISFIKTEKGYLSVNEIKKHLNSDNDEQLELFENITLNKATDFRSVLIAYLLKNNFEIILKIEQNMDRILVKKASDGVSTDYYLPPLFCINYDNLEILKYGNYPLNKQHWFCKWLLKICKSESFKKDREFLFRSFYKDFENSPLKRDEIVSSINKILKKYMEESIEKRDIITYRSEEKDLRRWLQVFE